MNSGAPHFSFQDAVIAEAVQQVEETGPLDDAQAMREAIALRSDGAGRILERARRLGQRIGLQDEWARARAASPWILLALVALIVLLGLGLAGNVAGESRSINVVVALTGLLGLHLLTLLLWLLGVVLPLGSLNLSLGWLWLALTARVAGGRHGQAPLLLGAATQLLARARLLPWVLGFASHAIWSLSFAVVLAALLFALAFRSYTLSWETTILDPAFFVRLVELLGRVPAWLGFPVPDAQTVLAPRVASAGQRDWALWLTGCIVAYGLLPRLFFALLCALVWKVRRQALGPELSQPYHRRLLARFEALAPRQIVDADPGSPRHGAPAGPAAGETRDMLLAIGFELPEELPWPPAALDAAGARTLRVDGSAGARREALDLLAQLRPRRLLVGCNAATSPDRGTERFLRELASLSSECRLWLLGSGASQEARDRWHAWLAETGLDRFEASDEAANALRGWA
ncbi:DUF2868 domain-containing protein [Variovorax sp. JS1663]|uniref:DUF2868 domain-containing protein n=1 Tax=Variovorax sp. JS1663 TaxID=1851577 RepID=UPI000B652631|nr:DUF2868 domain-containing protein [Variovorax sp. JS1663]OUM02871.1 hypothetical protein A8M77_07965 [Variovorax sp. JS1663]